MSFENYANKLLEAADKFEKLTKVTKTATKAKAPKAKAPAKK